MKQCEQERSGLAGTGLCLTCNVLAVERERQSLTLNRRALNETGFCDSLL